MSERKLTILQVNDLHGDLEPQPEVFRGRGGFRYRTCGGLARIASVFKQARAQRPCRRHAPGLVQRVALRRADPAWEGDDGAALDHRSTIELTGEALRAMLDVNPERTYSADPYCQMGGFVKRCRGMNLSFKMENPKEYRIVGVVEAVQGLFARSGQVRGNRRSSVVAV